ncbi:MAG TPA: DedA family protein [Candidatus Polarisedimenticolia bacterium]
MSFAARLLDMLLHVDRYLDQIIRDYGTGTYLLLFVVVFCETGLVVTPFLPGDSLLFAVGAFAARGSLDLTTSLILLAAAGILGDTANYWIGARVGPAVFHRPDSRFFKREHLDRTHRFYEKYGSKTIVLARFVPIVRTFAPFVAGIGNMAYARFLAYNVIGGVAWVGLFVLGGYYFGNIEAVRRNFSLVILAIITLSVLPIVIELIRHRRRSGR